MSDSENDAGLRANIKRSRQGLLIVYYSMLGYTAIMMFFYGFALFTNVG